MGVEMRGRDQEKTREPMISVTSGSGTEADANGHGR